LAIHDRCGTSIAAANLVTSVVFLVLLLGLDRFTLLNVVLAMVLVNLAGPVFGRLFQRFLTTNPRVKDVFVVSFECGVEHDGQGFSLFVNPAPGVPQVVCFIRTAVLDRPAA
jgi:hypothetical protein